MKNTICWFEIYVKDMERAKQFYNDVLHTTFKDMVPPGDAEAGMKMSFFDGGMNNGETDVSGALVQMPEMPNSAGGLNTIVYFPCMDCAVELGRVVSAGGRIHQAKMSIGEHGFCAIALDSEGNYFGLYSMQ